ncbi:MAG TPA: nuclear transport factor 2 family protein [Candidatus Tectomicrobia bacterium]|nr:nuclear transport factor 2 family protein [Candidatus Tectomicrobia bacterium]
MTAKVVAARAASCLALALLAGAWADARAQTRSRDEEVVRALDEQERAAAQKRDIAALERLWSEDFTVNAPTNQVVVGRRAVMDVFVRGGIINFATFDRTIEFVRVEGNLAFIMGGETVRPVGDAPMAGQTVHRRFTNVWRKEGDTWRLFMRHANNVPPR